MSGPLVALDGRRLQDDPLGGVGRGLRGLLPPLAARCEVTVLTDASRPAPGPIAGVELAPLPRPRGLPEAGWLHGAARRWHAGHPHVFHGTFNAIPVHGGRRSVVTIHDLSFEVHAEDFAGSRRRLLQQWFRVNARYAARHADVVVTVSRFSAEQIAERYGVGTDRLVTIPNAVDAVFRPDAAERLPDIAATLDLRRPYLVAVGGAARRGAEVAVDVWRAACGAGHELELVVLGGVDRSPSSGLHLLRNVPDATWAALLAGAEALVYPTRYEGFGLPGLEALASGTPVLAARGSGVTEVLGDAAAWCDAPTVDAMTPVLTGLLEHPGRAEDRRAAGLAHAAAWPTWDDIAARHEELYRGVG